jgi:hypothetical protein
VLGQLRGGEPLGHDLVDQLERDLAVGPHEGADAQLRVQRHDDAISSPAEMRYWRALGRARADATAGARGATGFAVAHARCESDVHHEPAQI